MSTLEKTISMMKTLPEQDLVKIQRFTHKIFQQREDKTADEAVGRFLKPMSREDFYRDLEIARKQAANGECMEMGRALTEIRAKYGI